MDTIMEPSYATVFGRAPIYDVAEFKSRAYNVNRHFSRYFTDPVAFRSLQAKTNTLVSGSDALQFLDRTFYLESDLDIYTHPGHSFEVAQFLVEAQGYRFAPRHNQENEWKDEITDDWDGTVRRIFRGRNEGYPLEGINGVWTFEKTDIKEKTLKVQIIEASSSPVEAILDFHSTVVMNFITSEAAYSLYPIATFAARSSLGMPSARTSPKAIQKYVQRGWRTYFTPTADDLAYPTKPPFMLDETRWVGDKYTWVLPLDQKGVKERPPLSRASAPLRFDHVRCNGWNLRVSKQLAPFGYETHAHRLQSTIFRYNYGIPEHELWVAIRAWANEQGRFSHKNLQQEDWVWFDADLPGFLRDSYKRNEGGSYP